MLQNILILNVCHNNPSQAITCQNFVAFHRLRPYPDEEREQRSEVFDVLPSAVDTFNPPSTSMNLKRVTCRRWSQSHKWSREMIPNVSGYRTIFGSMAPQKPTSASIIVIKHLTCSQVDLSSCDLIKMASSLMYSSIVNWRKLFFGEYEILLLTCLLQLNHSVTFWMIPMSNFCWYHLVPSTRLLHAFVNSVY